MKEYRKIPSLKFLYEISSTGVIRNVKSKKILIPTIDKDGYACIALKNNQLKYKGTTNRKIHRLVAECWIEHKPDNWQTLTIDHLDCNKLNNDYHNLEFVTLRENSLRRYRNNIEKENEHLRELNYSRYGHFIYQAKSDDNNVHSFATSLVAADYILSFYPDKNYDTIKRRIRDASKKNKYAYGFHWSRKYID